MMLRGEPRSILPIRVSWSEALVNIVGDVLDPAGWTVSYEYEGEACSWYVEEQDGFNPHDRDEDGDALAAAAMATVRGHIMSRTGSDEYRLAVASVTR